MKAKDSGIVPNESITVSKSWWSRFDRIISKFLFGGAQIQGKIAAFCMILLALVTFTTVVGRRSPWSGAWLVGGLEISELLMAIISIYAAAYCWYLHGHLRITFIYDHVGAKMRNVLDILSSLAFTFWLLAISWGMWLMTVTYIRTGAKGWSIGIPYGPFMAAFLLATTFFSLIVLKDLLDQVMKLMGFSIKNGKDSS